jgi:phage repressor protein C with HTH and peptisase S24 domain
VEASAAGGTLISDEREDKPFFFRRSWVRDKLHVSTNDLRVVDVRGDSMLPTLSGGDVVLVNLKDRAPTPPGIFVLFDGLGLVLKRLEFHNPEAVQIISDNPQYAPYTRAMKEINIIGRVVWFAREL